MITGKLAEAPIQNAKETFKLCAKSAKKIDKIAIEIDQERAAATCCLEVSLPFLIISP